MKYGKTNQTYGSVANDNIKPDNRIDILERLIVL